MKNVILFISGLIFSMLLVLFNAFVYMSAYKLAFAPFINYFTSAPDVPFSIFILLNLGINACRLYKKPKYAIGEKEYWNNLSSALISRSLLVIILFVCNLIIL